MKKLLIASTALVATSGFAYAEVTLGGTAQFGIIYLEDRSIDGDKDELFLDYELQFDFSASGETDGGLGFGMSAELESDSDREGNQSQQGVDPEIFVTGGFGTVTVGALDTAPDQAGFGSTRDPGYDGIGIDNLIDAILFLDATALFNSDESGKSNIMYQGAFGGLSIVATVHAYEEDYGAVVSYDFGNFDVGVSYMNLDETVVGASDESIEADPNNPGMIIFTPAVAGTAGGGDTWGVTFGGSFAGFDFDFVYADHDNDFDKPAKAYGLSGSYDIGAYELVAAVNHVKLEDFDVNGKDIDGTAYGIGVNYDLGGGASLSAGVGSIWDPSIDDDRTTASFGINMSF